MLVQEEGITCFVCTRCRYPICPASDVILESIKGGTTDAAFQYQLDDVLKLGISIPCYSRMEAVTWKMSLTPELLTIPFFPRVREKLLQTFLQAAKEKRRLLEGGAASCGGDGNEHDSHRTSTFKMESLSDIDRTSTSCLSTTPSSTLSETEDSSMSARRLQTPSHSKIARVEDSLDDVFPEDNVTESRIDIFCVSSKILGLGVLPCEKAKSRDVLGASSSLTPRSGHARGEKRSVSVAMSSDDLISEEELGEFARSGEVRTSVATGIAECGVEVERTTVSAEVPWFKEFDCTGRVECPDCHLPLGFIFVHNTQKAPQATLDTRTEESSFSLGRECEGVEVRLEPYHQKRKKECEEEEKSLCSTPSVEASSETVLGIEVKNVKVEEWTLQEFQKRYCSSKDVQSFRGLFPGVKDVEYFENHIEALHADTMLVRRLCVWQKERQDHDEELFKEMRERLDFYKEKLKAMEEVIASLKDILFNRYAKEAKRDSISDRLKEVRDICKMDVECTRRGIIAKENEIAILHEKITLLGKLRELGAQINARQQSASEQ